jgi:Cu2+-exporting ATPase
MTNSNGDHHHEHHDGHAGAAGHPGFSAPDHAPRTEPPMEPGDSAYAGHGAYTGHGEGGHDRHAGHSVEMFRDTFWISLLLTIPTII